MPSRFFFVLLIFFISIAVLYYIGKRTNHSRSPDAWTRIIKLSGPQAANSQFKNKTATQPYKKQHQLAHEFGRSLYAALETSGIAFCDDAYGYGCFHGFFTLAFPTLSPASLENVTKACSSRPYRQNVECLHGAGHGIIATLGHNNITKAIEMCELVAPGPTAKACATGVFMESNFRSMDDTASGKSVRPLDPLHPHIPCQSVPPLFIDYCYRFQASWWFVVYEKDLLKIEALCLEGATPSAKKNCLLGIGFSVAASTNFDVPSTRIQCSMLASKYNQAICLAGAASGFFKIKKLETVAPSLCDALSLQNKQVCLTNIERIEQL